MRTPRLLLTLICAIYSLYSHADVTPSGTIFLCPGETRKVYSNASSDYNQNGGFNWRWEVEPSYAITIQNKTIDYCDIRAELLEGSNVNLYFKYDYYSGASKVTSVRRWILKHKDPPSYQLMASPSGSQVEEGTKVYLTMYADGSPVYDDVNIYYTLDGSEPDRNSTIYTSSGITINNSCTLKAWGIRWYNGTRLTETYTIESGPDPIIQLSASPSGGQITAGTIVILTTTAGDVTISGYDIYYTTDGTLPSMSSTKYTTSGIKINNDCTLKAIAYKEGYKTSDILTTSYTIEPIRGIEINATNFPDENFRNDLLSLNYGQDGVLTEDEISRITIINISNKGIANLKGIEYFTALISLYCYNNQLTSLDLSKNTELIELDCYYNQLTALDVSKNTVLTQLECNNNQLSSLDVSNNTALMYLNCNRNQLASLDVSKSTALEQLYCGANLLTYLDLSRNTALKELNCSENKLTTLNVSNNTELERLFCRKNQIKGEEMDKLIYSLPNNTTINVRQFCAIAPKSNDEGNVLTKLQCAAVKTKGWFPCYWDINNGEYVEYEGSEIVKPENIILHAEATVAAGQTITLTPEITPAQAEYTLTWSSDDETVATVNQNGVVMGVKKGKTFINVETDNGKTAYCKLTVTAPEPIKIELSKNATITVGENITLKPTITPEGAETTLTWNSDDASVVRVNANGVLTGVAEGLAIVTASTSNGLTSNACKVKVEPDPSGISTVMMDEKTIVPIYTPSGQRLTAPRKGVNIVNGKKVVVR